MSTNAPTKLPVKQSYASMAPTKLPVKQSYASMTHGDVISKGIQLNRENANCIQLSDNDLIKVEYTTFVVLVKVKEIDSINNMFCICRNEGNNEGTSFSMESNNDGKHDDVENKDVDSDATIPPGFETFFKVDKHGSRSSRTGKCSTSFGNYKRKDMKGFSFIDEMNRMIEVGGALGYNIKGSIRSLRRMINREGVSMLGKMRIPIRLKEAGLDPGRSGGLVSMWDPGVFTKTRIWYGDNYIIVEGKRTISVDVYYLINVYGPQQQPEKANMWALLRSFIQNHAGKIILFGDLNEVRNETERSSSSFSSGDATIFNSFIHDVCLIDLPMGDGVLQAHSDMHVTALDRLWSDRNLILLHAEYSRKKSIMSSLRSLEENIDAGCTNGEYRVICVNRLQELDGLEKLECMDLVQKALLRGNID
ncbi:RNA-directed DNA polymerase, eukaryota, reverse transcriptase zinc-binding domain protein [Tanacetum coccineum]